MFLYSSEELSIHRRIDLDVMGGIQFSYGYQ